jgi:probable phosphoglycerate mutase
METARLLGRSPIADDTLIEMDWGDWEGLPMAEVSNRLDPARRHFGLDYAAPSGESPRAVQDRLRSFLEARADNGSDILAVTHKGVIRALYALAVGWTMENKPPHKLDFTAGQLFEFDRQTGLLLQRLNVPLNGQAS